MATGPLPPSPDGRARPLLRQGIPGEKKPLLEKVLTFYDQLFQVVCLCWCFTCLQYWCARVWIRLLTGHISGRSSSCSRYPYPPTHIQVVRVPPPPPHTHIHVPFPPPHTHTYTRTSNLCMQVNVEYMTNKLDQLEAQELITLKVGVAVGVVWLSSLPSHMQKVLNRVFVQSCRTLQVDDNMIRTVNALQVSSVPFSFLVHVLIPCFCIVRFSISLLTRKKSV